jgi:hypothetical protein
MDEIALTNKNGTTLKSKDSEITDAVTATAVSDDLSMANGTGHFKSGWAGVTLMDQPGDKTWPLLAFSYLYIRKDLSAVALGETAPLIKAEP